MVQLHELDLGETFDDLLVEVSSRWHAVAALHGMGLRGLAACRNAHSISQRRPHLCASCGLPEAGDAHLKTSPDKFALLKDVAEVPAHALHAAWVSKGAARRRERFCPTASEC